MAEKSHTASRGKSAMGGGGHKSASKSHSKPHAIHIHRGHSGGFIAQHHFKPGTDGQMPEPEDHVIPDMPGLQAHIADNMGDQGPAPAAPAPAPAPAPQAGPAPAPQGM